MVNILLPEGQSPFLRRRWLSSSSQASATWSALQLGKKKIQQMKIRNSIFEIIIDMKYFWQPGQIIWKTCESSLEWSKQLVCGGSRLSLKFSKKTSNEWKFVENCRKLLDFFKKMFWNKRFQKMVWVSPLSWQCQDFEKQLKTRPHLVFGQRGMAGWWSFRCRQQGVPVDWLSRACVRKLHFQHHHLQLWLVKITWLLKLNWGFLGSGHPHRLACPEGPEVGSC